MRISAPTGEVCEFFITEKGAQFSEWVEVEDADTARWFHKKSSFQVRKI